MSNNRNLNSVFYAETYHPIQAGSIDGTDIVTHDNAIYRALLCSNASLYDPFGDPKVKGDPYCTLFVTRLSHSTTEDTLLKAMNKYGRVKNLRLVRHIVTGASCGYAFVEFESEKEMYRAYKEAHHTYIDDSEILVDYNRQNLMPGWIPRRLGGGLGGKKESGQIRFGGRERPFRAPLRPIPWDDLKRLGIPAPPEGRYMPRHQIPSPPRRKRGSSVNEESRVEKSRSPDRLSSRKRSKYSEESRVEKSRTPDRSSSRNKSRYSERGYNEEQRESRDSYRYEKRRSSFKKESKERISIEREERSSRHHRSSHGDDRWRSNSRDRYYDD